MDDVTEATTMIAVQGPSAIEALQPLTPLPLAGMKRFTHTESTVKGIRAVITRTGYTGEDGFEIIVYDAASGAMAVWEALAKSATPCALGRKRLAQTGGRPAPLRLGHGRGDEPPRGGPRLGNLEGQAVLRRITSAGCD